MAIIGSGPAAMYAADELLTIPRARVSVYERLAQPYGLVRTGVAPDHRRTRRIARQLDQIRRQPGLRMHLGVEVGRDITIQQLLQTHHAVVHAGGTATERKLRVPGSTLPGVVSAGAFAGWYNGHPDHAHRKVDLAHPRAVVIGNGNVALDIARILTIDPESLEGTDIAPAALAALRRSSVKEVVIVGRRGPQHAAFTLPELIGLSTTPGVEVMVANHDPRSALNDDLKVKFLRGLPAVPDAPRRIRFRFGLTPTRMVGDGHVGAVHLAPMGDGTAAEEHISAGLVVTSIGYRGTPVDGLPFDPVSGVVPNVKGRVVDPATGAPVTGAYVAGWIKRGPRGFIGTNRVCSQDTVASLVDDFNAGLLGAPGMTAK